MADYTNSTISLAEYKGSNGSNNGNVFSAYGTVSEEMECPHNRVGLVIGAKGSVIQEIMRRSGCKITICQDGIPEGQSRKITVTGSPNQVFVAKSIITSVINDGVSSLRAASPPSFETSEPSMTQYLDCPHSKVALVIGAKGVIIQDIMSKSGCKITINQNLPDGEPRIIVITGKAASIEVAKNLIQKVLIDGPTALISVDESEDIISDDMECPAEKVGIVIGARGTIVQDIMRKTGSRILINQDFPDGHPRVITVVGTPEQVEAGKALITAVILHGPSAVQMSSSSAGATIHEMKIQQSQVGKLIGPGGSTIKEIQQRYGVKMVVDQATQESGERKLRITGEPDRVQATANLVWNLLHTSGEPGGGQFGLHVMPPFGAPQSPTYYSNAPQGVYGGQGLGADGTAGRIMPLTQLPNGTVHQVVYLMKSQVGRVVGKNFSILALIMAKSGSNIQIDTATVLSATGQEMCKMNVTGTVHSVSLSGQMIQEVLIDGPNMLRMLPDAVQVSYDLNVMNPSNVAYLPPVQYNMMASPGFGFLAQNGQSNVIPNYSNHVDANEYSSIESSKEWGNNSPSNYYRNMK